MYFVCRVDAFSVVCGRKELDDIKWLVVTVVVDALVAEVRAGVGGQSSR